MSFSFEAKRELCRVPLGELPCARAEAYGILLYCNTFRYGEIRIITENPLFAARLPKLFHRAFRLRFDALPEPGAEGKRVFRFTSPEKLRRVVEILGYAPRRTPVLHINFALLEDDCCRAAFLRGAFFAGGSVTDPRKRYHLELLTTHAQAGRELQTILRDLGFESKTLQRNGAFTTYCKQSGQIAEFLRFVGAPEAAQSLLSAKDAKRLRNSVNRRLNCDTANVDKSVEASREQAEAIRRLRAAGLLETLSDKLQLTAALRLEYPELSLSELAEEFDPPVTKSCLNHRLRKLMELAEAP